MYLNFSVLRGDFPELQLSCPFTYNREEERYIVDFQFTAAFSRATLSHTQVFVVRVDSFQRPFSPIQLGLSRDNIDVS